VTADIMPRDLNLVAKEDSLQGMPQLTKSPDEVEEREPPMDADDEDDMIESFQNGISDSNPKRDELHPYTQTLTLSDVDSCTTLEEATFPPHERCTKEKVRAVSTHCSCICRRKVNHMSRA
jgi:hypothetical protein